MKHKNILKKSWVNLWAYRALWIFGVILALTTSTTSAQSNYSFNSSDFDNPSQGSDFGDWDDAPEIDLLPGETLGDLFGKIVDEVQRQFDREFNQKQQRTITTVAVVSAVLIILLSIIGKVFQYVSRTALVTMVNDYEETEKKYSVREGFGIGWSATAWRMFLLDLIIFLPLFVVSVTYLGLISIPLFTSDVFSGGDMNVFSVVTSIGLFFLFIFAAIIISAVIGLLKEFMYRKLVLEKMGIVEAIKAGNAFVWQNFKEVGLMWLIKVGINLVWPLALFPVVLLLLIPSGMLGGIVALITYGVSGGFAPIVAILGGSALLLILLPPLILIGGWKQTYFSNVWTLTYRELNQINLPALESVVPEEQAPA